MGKKAGNPAVIGTILIVLSSIISISLFINDFKISVAIVLLPLFAFLFSDFPVMKVSFFSGIGVYFLRLFVYFLSNGYMGAAFSAYWQEIFFYITYGVLLNFYLRKYTISPLKISSLVPLIIIDFTSNFVEIYLRLGFGGLVPFLLIQLIVVAAARTFMAGILMFTFDYYGIAVLEQEDAQRYRKLVLMASDLNSELCWLDKSSDLIESTMSKAYNLYTALSRQEDMAELSKDAMSIARDIHEVKKEYMVIMRGIRESLRNSTLEDSMDIKKISSILKKSINSANEKNVNLYSSIKENFQTDRHYLLMSVLNNLFTNSIEACTADKEVNIWMDVYFKGDDCVIAVKDDSGGVREDLKDKIFLPFFSSKINYDTGEINRGIGLSVVKDITEGIFGGKISFESWDKYTEFVLEIPKKNLLGDL